MALGRLAWCADGAGVELRGNASGQRGVQARPPRTQHPRWQSTLAMREPCGYGGTFGEQIFCLGAKSAKGLVSKRQNTAASGGYLRTFSFSAHSVAYPVVTADVGK